MIGTQPRWQDELFIAGSMVDLVPEDHLLRRIDRVLDLSWLRDELRSCYCEHHGRPGIDPEAAVRLMLAGLCQGIVHDRQLMREAQVNVAIRWFAGYRLDEQLPHHSSLTRLRQRWGSERFRRIFQRTVHACVDAGLVGGDLVHVDATLIRADVSWESVVEQRLEAVWQANQAEPNSSGRKEKRSTTDPDATLATSSRAQKAEPSYKQHTTVDGRRGVVLDVEATTGKVNESQLMLARLEEAQTTTGHRIRCVTADAGYAYGKIYGALERQSVDAVIPPKAEPKLNLRMPLRRFKYDARHQVVRCPRGKSLHRSTRDGDRWYYRSRMNDCRHCPIRTDCLSPKAQRRTVVLGDDHEALLRARRRRRRWDADLKQAYRQHRWRSEGAHAEAKMRHGLRRAVRRGLANVQIQVYLTAAAMNLKRLAG